MEMRTTFTSAPSPACSVTACKLRERIYAPHALVRHAFHGEWNDSMQLAADKPPSTAR
jgi:hypothetical protein